jgi:hypothetical protein
MSERTGSQSLVVFGGIAVLLALVVLLPVVGLFARQSGDLDQARQDLAVYRAELAARPRLEDELRTVSRQAVPANGLFSDDNASLAAAAMQGFVKSLVERHGGQVRSAQALTATAANGLDKIAVQFELSIPLASLKAATYDLETGTPYLFLDAVDIRPELYAAAGAPANLHVTWTVHGYRQQRPR